jgi:hypothetical protein
LSASHTEEGGEMNNWNDTWIKYQNSTPQMHITYYSLSLVGARVVTTQISLVKRFRILAQALRLGPRLFWSKQVITKGFKKGFRMLLGRAYGRH